MGYSGQDPSAGLLFAYEHPIGELRFSDDRRTGSSDVLGFIGTLTTPGVIPREHSPQDESTYTVALDEIIAEEKAREARFGSS
jgi:hypothetical protein